MRSPTARSTSHRRRITTAAVAALGAVVPLGAGVAGAAPAHAQGQTGTAVNGPIMYSRTLPGGTPEAFTINPDGSGATPPAAANSCADGTGGTQAIQSLAYSPNGTEAAYVCNNAIHIGSADLGTIPFAYFDPKGANLRDLVWSPDGGTLYFTRQVTAQGQPPVAYSIHADGTGAAPVAGLPAGAVVKSVAPNGALLVLAETGTTGWPVVSILDPGSSTPRSFMTAVPGPVFDAAFSPDGSQVAVTQGTAAAPATPEVLVYDANSTGNGTVVADQAPVASGGSAETIWSPDGTELAFAFQVRPQAPNSSEVSQMWVVSAQKSAAAQKIVDVPGGGLDGLAWHDGPIPARPRGVETRLSGGDRIATAVAVADAAYNPALPGTSKASVAVLSRSDSYADALAGNALAAEKHGPLLLTGTAKLDPTVGAELKKVLAPGAVVYVLGGDKALSPQIDADLRALDLNPHRLSGLDRYSTALSIAAEISSHPHTVLVATGNNDPDALAAGAAAANDPQGGVVVLSDDGILPTAVRNYLAAVNPATTRVYGVGVQGVQALGTAPNLAGYFTPLKGNDRYGTDLAVASDPTLFPKVTSAGIATGGDWPDALAGGAFIGAEHGPLLLADTVPGLGPGNGPNAYADNWLYGHSLTLTSLTVFGGTNAVPAPIAADLANSAFGKGNWDAR